VCLTLREEKRREEKRREEKRREIGGGKCKTLNVMWVKRRIAGFEGSQAMSVRPSRKIRLDIR
jgi:hypothetical protein